MTDVPEAWVALPTTQEIERRLGSSERHPYSRTDSFPQMGRLVMVHERIGPKVLALFQTVMFEAEHITRAETEMLAAVSAAAQDCFY